MTPKVVHCGREEFEVYVGRPTKWGNPVVLPPNATMAQRLECIRAYREWIATQPYLLSRLPELRGKVLGCWCSPKPCHADVLLELANRSEDAESKE